MTPSPSPASCSSPPPERPALLLAGLSVRQLAQAAARDGFRAIALDAFGDRDTLQAAARWQPWRSFDGPGLLAALDDAAAQGALGWIAGSGFEAHPALLEAGATRLPLLGTPPAGWRRLRDPRAFFPLLRALGLPHPETRWDAAPLRLQGWLLKDGAGCGGTHVRPAAGAAAAAGGWRCWQRRVDGVPMSAAFVADGRGALLLGFNRQLVGLEGAPFAWRGAIGPVPVPAPFVSQVETALRRLVPACGLRGLGSLDFIRRPGGDLALLEVNPRPGGTLQLYAAQAPLRLHVAACLEGPLPAQPAPQATQGLAHVFARRPLRLDAARLALLARRGNVHDLPAAPAAFNARDPVCTLSAAGPDPDAVHALLQRRCAALLDLLEKESCHELAC